jgi:hypothetical protein
MRYGLIAAGKSAICKLTVYLSLLHAQCNQSLKNPDRECTVQYLYIPLTSEITSTVRHVSV